MAIKDDKNKKNMTTEIEKGHHTVEDGHISQEAVADAFEQQQDIMAEIYNGGFAEYAETLQDLPDAFDLEKHKPVEELHRCVCCMDGRTPYGKHLAGGGMLLPPEELKKAYAEMNPDSISSHTGCGAAVLYCNKMGLDPKQAESIAWQWAEDQAKALGVPHIHLEVDKPFHSERVCYYDGTGEFNYKGVKGLPEGFVVGRKFMDKQSSQAEAQVSKDIIFGHHGFGKELLNEENPFVFVAIGETQEEVEKLKKELEEIAKPFGMTVKIDGFVKPGAKK